MGPPGATGSGGEKGLVGDHGDAGPPGDKVKSSHSRAEKQKTLHFFDCCYAKREDLVLQDQREALDPKVTKEILDFQDHQERTVATALE